VRRVSATTATFDVSSPADIAAARARLDALERRQRADAEAERARAQAEAAEAAEAAFRAEVASVLGPAEPVHAARNALAEARRRHADALAEVAAAQAQVSAAKALLPQLVERAVAGDRVDAAAVASAHAAVQEAERFAAFLGGVAVRLEAPIHAAEAGLKAALAEQHRPVFELGGRYRYESAQAAKRARAAATPDRAAVDAAKAIFDRGNRLMRLATDNHVDVFAYTATGVSDVWPPDPDLERRRWRIQPDGDANAG
jgi:hypothetical protein